MKVIFLDIDGVMNSGPYVWGGPVARGHGLHGDEAWADLIDPAAVAILNQLCEATNAVVVLSSSWREPFARRKAAFRGVMASRGFRGIIFDHTPLGQECEGHTGQRGFEVALWLRRNPDVHDFVILDDSDGFDGLRDRLVRTNPAEGLTYAEAERAAAILRNEAP